MTLLEPGAAVAGYRVERVLGRGGMGRVYLATQLALERLVALKVIAPELADDAVFRRRFVEESRIAASIDHPHVIPVHEAGERDGLLFLAMRYVDGPNLKELVAKRGPLVPALVVRVVAQVADALHAAHATGLVHRDVKPANVLVAGDGGREHAYLSDFGLTKRSASENGPTESGSWVGTLDYVAPEQLRGEAVDGRADVYALGCVLFEALTGRPPFPRDTDVAKLWAHVADPVPSAQAVVREVPEALDAVIARAMSKVADDRFASAAELGAAATAALQRGGGAGAPGPSGARPAGTGGASGTSKTSGAGRSSSVLRVGLTAPSSEAGVLPPPPALALRRGPLLGREAELAELDRARSLAATEGLRVVLVAGEPGIGKTRLTLAGAQHAAAQGAVVLHGRSNEEAIVPYEPWLEALGHLLAHVDEQQLAWVVGDGGAELARLFPELRRRCPDLSQPVRAEPETERWRLFEAVSALLGAVSAEHPVVVVLDDVHWADRSTLLLLRHVVRARRQDPLTVVLTARETEVAPDAPLRATLAELRRDQVLTKITLSGLGEEEVASLVSRRRGRALDADFVRALHQETEGNPFFVEEVLRNLPDVDTTSGGSVTAIPVPESVREAVGRRLTGLSGLARDVLPLAAVIGRDFDLDLLEAVSDAPLPSPDPPSWRSQSPAGWCRSCRPCCYSSPSLFFVLM